MMYEIFYKFSPPTEGDYTQWMPTGESFAERDLAEHRAFILNQIGKSDFLFYEVRMVETQMDKRQKVYAKAFEKFGYNNQFVVAMEECGELIKEIAKTHRGEINQFHLAEEIADVRIMCEQLEYFFKLHDQVKKWEEIKIQRLEERI